jgi:hypothetical protein
MISYIFVFVHDIFLCQDLSSQSLSTYSYQVHLETEGIGSKYKWFISEEYHHHNPLHGLGHVWPVLSP